MHRVSCTNTHHDDTDLINYLTNDLVQYLVRSYFNKNTSKIFSNPSKILQTSYTKSCKILF